MSATRKATTGGSRPAPKKGVAGAGTRAKPRSTAPRATTAPAPKGRVASTRSVSLSPPLRIAPATRGLDNRPLWLILGALAVVDVVFAIVAIAR